MFPIHDHNPSGRVPYVTYALMAANILLFAIYGWWDEDRIFQMYDDWAIIPAEVVAGHQQFTILTAMFLHGGFMHLAGNMLFLYIFGDNLEDTLGHVVYLIFYLACGVVASIVQISSDPASLVPNIGASGAISGVMSGYLLFFPKARIDCILILVIIVKKITLPAWAVLGMWFALQLLGGVSSISSDGGVAYWAHLGGFFAGLAAIGALMLVSGLRPRWRI